MRFYKCPFYIYFSYGCNVDDFMNIWRVSLIKNDFLLVFRELKMCSVGPGGSSWAINSKNKILYRAGAKSSNPIGTKWQEISGQLIHISVGKAGVWGITPEHQVRNYHCRAYTCNFKVSFRNPNSQWFSLIPCLIKDD